MVGVAQTGDVEAEATAAAARLRERLGRMQATEQRRGQRRRAVLAPAAAAASAPPTAPLPAAPATGPEPAAPSSLAPDPITTAPIVPPDAPRAAPVAEPKRQPEPAPPPRPELPAPVRRPLAAEAPRPAIPAPDQLAGKGEMRAALEASKRALKAVGWFSCGINVLMLTGPIFMLQVYDRVIASGSYWTLSVLLVITAALYAVIGALEYIRTRVITRIGVEIDQRIGDRVFEASMRKSLGGPGQATSALRELDTLRSFVAGPAPMTAFDLVWTPVYLLVIFFTHWTLGIASIVGMAALLFCAWLSDAQGKAPLAEASKAANKGIDLAETGARNADSITAMGMLGAYRARWQKTNQQALGWQVLASDRLGGTSAVSKTLRLLMQSVMLAIGAALAMHGDITAGSIIAGTIIFGRALAPVEQVITHWKASAKAHEAFKKLEALLAAVPPRHQRTSLPRPSGRVSVEALRVAAPDTKTLILSGITCEIMPGKLLAVIGPSASGKSTFIRALVGLWPAFAGTIKLDGVRLDQWHPEDLGQYVGYLPQDVELFSGTVRDNIARFQEHATDADVVGAAKAAHAHELIMGLTKGYETELGAFGAYLSAGQRQRIGLARALYGTPPLVVLDEPNANLDRVGDEALAAAIDGMRARGQAVVMVSHRVQAIGKADLLLFIERGVQRAFGPREEVMRQLGGAAAAEPQKAAPTAAAGRG